MTLEEFTETIYKKDFYPEVVSHIDLSKEFRTSEFWLDKSLEVTEMYPALLKIGYSLVTYISGMPAYLKHSTKDSSYFNVVSKELNFSVAPLFDEGVSRNIAVDVVISTILHESLHAKYTFTDISKFCLKEGYVVDTLDARGNVIPGPDLNGFSYIDDFHANIFNILEDSRVESLGIKEFPGILGYMQVGRSYYLWKYYTSRATFPVSTGGALYDYFMLSILEPELLPYIYDWFAMRDGATFNSERLELQKALEGYKEADFSQLFAISKRVRELLKDYNHKQKFSGVLLGGNLPKGAFIERQSFCEQEAELASFEESKMSEELSTVDVSRLKKNNPYFQLDKYDKTTITQARKGVSCRRDVIEAAKTQAKAIKTNLAFLDSKFSRTEEVPEQDSGEIDEDELYAKKFSPDIFVEEVEKKGYSLDVFILMDESGSMNTRVKHLIEASLALAYAFMNKHNIRLFVYGHTACVKGDYSVNLTRYLDPLIPKSNDFSTLLTITAKGENVDGVAILEAGKILRKSPSKKKLLLVISDGAPAAPGYSSDAAVDHTALCVKTLEARGVEVVQIAVANIAASPRMFKNYIPYDSTTLGEKLFKFMRSKFTEISEDV